MRGGLGLGSGMNGQPEQGVAAARTTREDVRAVNGNGIGARCAHGATDQGGWVEWGGDNGIAVVAHDD